MRKTILALSIAALSSVAMADDLPINSTSVENPIVNELIVGDDYDPNGIIFTADADSTDSNCLAHFPIDSVVRTNSKKMANRAVMLCFNNFVSIVSEDTKAPLLVSERITKGMLVESYNYREQVKVRFHEEPRLPNSYRATDEMYKQTVYESSPYKMATLVNPYFQVSSFDMDNAFSFANVLPLNRDLRNKLWVGIEKGLRLYLYEHAQDGFIVSGAYYNPNETNFRLGGVTGVGIPTHVYKAFYFPNQGVASVYWMKNDDSGRYEVLSLDELKQRTNIDLFPMILPEIKATKVYPPKPFYGSENYLGAAENFVK